jgi:hypothetical protein
MFPLIQGILAFDTPFNGLARPMFVYGAFSNYQKVSNVFNVMTAIGAAAPAGLARLGASRGVASAAGRSVASSSRSSPAWKAWQLVAVRTGTVGAIAAGGVAAYMHRRRILDGIRSINASSIRQGYQQSVDAIGQGLAYINRGNVGQSFAWLSDHFTFVGALLRQQELGRRLDRLAALRGVGIADVYVSLGENGVWSGGYFVPERTFCAIPMEPETKEEKEKSKTKASDADMPSAARLFRRRVVDDVEDEVQAHLSLFKKDKNTDYDGMTTEAAKWVVQWFNDESELWDDPRFATPLPATGEEVNKKSEEVHDGQLPRATLPTNARLLDEAGIENVVEAPTNDEADFFLLPDESPLNVAAAASLIPLPDEEDDEDLKIREDNKGSISTEPDGKKHQAQDRQAYMRHLFTIAQQTRSNLKSFLPAVPPPKLPDQMTESMKRVQMPNITMPSVSMPSVSIPSVNLFSRKKFNATKDDNVHEEESDDVIQDQPCVTEGNDKAESQQEEQQEKHTNPEEARMGDSHES